MDIDIVQLELIKKGSISIDDSEGFAYGIDTTKKLFLNEISKCNVEMVGLVCMDNTNKIINYANVAIGGITNVKVPVAQIFKVALMSNSSQIIIAHNHPSGVMKITKADIELTKHISMIASYFEIKLIDSLIVGQGDKVISIRENIKELDNE